MEMHRQHIAYDLGITEQEALSRLERSGSNMVHGTVRGDRTPIYYSVFTERSDVSVTTAAVGAPGILQLSSPSEVRGYRLFIAPSQRGVLIFTTDKSLAHKLHDYAIGEARLGGATHALGQVVRVAHTLGVEATPCGISNHRTDERATS